MKFPGNTISESHALLEHRADHEIEMLSDSLPPSTSPSEPIPTIDTSPVPQRL
ncbi:hypothetical protein M404DRAFT_1003182 [Pisolithus tinctorius Marx 270]|uniref:Uncharacterized protein n=1 Tax=Pisolithus tinctorius Marx 270 TaxID=870435 RepID=A0A0C3NJV6_PISTI|nr:hypothetical protein M404DRAFT_1003182 [Pisolithus tinctorius Marx 270]